MDLRALPDGLTPAQRIDERRKRIEEQLDMDVKILKPQSKLIGQADEKNCEQMFGHIPLPIGLAGPLTIQQFSNQQSATIYLPLATTEGALVASVNRGCKALTESGGVMTQSIHHGITRSIAFKITDESSSPIAEINHHQKQWKAAAEKTSGHLKILRYDIDTQDEYLFLNIACATDEAMGMNMVTIAAQAVGQWLAEFIDGLQFITVAGNVDSDKKPSQRTHSQGRGYEVRASAHIPKKVITSILKSTPEAMLEVAKAKLEVGSGIAGAIGKNLHAANMIAALYLATGQDAAHVVEGSLTDTTIKKSGDGIDISVRCPAILVGIRGGGTALPAQSKALEIILKEKMDLHPCAQLAESIGAGVLAGELSLLAAQASHMLAKAHGKLGR
ncbi:MAG: hypothetical protein KBD00_05655 [Candidatus Peribacteraceae bacterium]|nr:hypothetical protein [Candidatus Peribacteraceae bacterium]